LQLNVLHKIAASAAQLANCFVLIHVQLRLPATQVQTRTSFRLFIKLA